MDDLPDSEPEEMHACQHAGCNLPGRACWLPEAQEYIEIDGQRLPLPDAWYCGQHAPRHGHCSGCGDFWGGIESFEMSGLCDFCRSELDHEREMDRMDYEDDYDYP